jgi:hypothetical protein
VNQVGNSLATTKAEDQVKSGLLLNVVIREGAAIFKLLSSEDETLLIWGDTLFVLDLSLDVLDRVGWLNIKGDGLAGESLDEDLHTTTESEDQVKSGLFLDIIVGEGAAVFKLLSSEDKALLVWRNTFLVLNLSLDVLDGVGWLNIKGDGLSGEGLDEDLHTTAESENQVKCRLFLDIVVREGTTVFKLLSSKYETLLVWRDTFLVLDLCFDVFDSVGWFDVESDGLSGEGLDENLHVASVFN